MGRTGTTLSKEQVHEMKLSDYLATSLAESQDCLTSKIKDQARLVHIDSLVELLNRIVNPDPMEELPDMYKAKASSTVASTIQSAVASLEGRAPQIADAMVTFAADYLAGGIAGPDTSLCEWLANAPDLAEDDELIGDMEVLFGPDVLMKYYVQVYEEFKSKLQPGAAQ